MGDEIDLSAVDDVDKESLRIEYKIAHGKHDYYGRTLWQVGAIIIPATLAGFGFALQQDLSLDKLVALNMVLSLLLVMFLFTVRRLRWLALLHLSRCEEIEKILPMKLATYQKLANEKEIKIGSNDIKRQHIKSKHINQWTPIILLIIFWLYVIYKLFIVYLMPT